MAESSTGPVKISPEGMFRLPSELIQVRPPTERVGQCRRPRSGSFARRAMNSTSPAWRRPSSCQAIRGVGLIEKQGPNDERFVFRQGHLGVGRVRGSRELGQYPARPPGRLADRVAGTLVDRLSPASTLLIERVSLSAAIRMRAPTDCASKRADGGHECQLGFGCVLDKELVQSGELESHQRMSSPPDDCLKASLDQRPAENLGAQGDGLSRFDFQAVIDQKIGPTLDHAVLQPPRSFHQRDKCRSPRLSLSHRW